LYGGRRARFAPYWLQHLRSRAWWRRSLFSFYKIIEGKEGFFYAPSLFVLWRRLSGTGYFFLLIVFVDIAFEYLFSL
jgi:hypothetical protein